MRMLSRICIFRAKYSPWRVEQVLSKASRVSILVLGCQPEL